MLTIPDRQREAADTTTDIEYPTLSTYPLVHWFPNPTGTAIVIEHWAMCVDMGSRRLVVLQEWHLAVVTVLAGSRMKATREITRAVGFRIRLEDSLQIWVAGG